MNVDALLKLQPEQVDAAAKSWMDLADALDDCRIELTNQTLAPIEDGIWQGTAADFATTEITGHQNAIGKAAKSARAIGKAMATAADQWRVARAKLVRAIEDAPDAGVKIAPDGTAEPAPGKTPAPNDITEFTVWARAALAEAEMTDQDLAKVLTTHGEAGIAPPPGVPSLLKTVPGPGTDPKKVREWWDSLTIEERAQVIQWKPEAIGNLDGIPATIRHRANLVTLEAKLDELLDRKQLLYEASPTAEQHNKRNSEILELSKQIEAINMLKSRIYGSWSNGETPLYLLGFDGAHDGKAIVSIGNPDTAKHTSVYVPGTSGAFYQGFDVDLYRAQSMYESASVKTKEPVASILWLDYDAPDTVPLDAPSPDYAKNGGPKLRDFLDGLTTTHQGGGSHTTVVGHSYGLRVIGEAALVKPDLKADIISVGGAGLGVDKAPGFLPSYDKLKIDGNIYDATSRMDPIQAAYDRLGLVGLHGSGPQNLPGVTSLDVEWNNIHTTYWENDEKFLKNVGYVIAGEKDKLTYELKN